MSKRLPESRADVYTRQFQNTTLKKVLYSSYAIHKIMQKKCINRSLNKSTSNSVEINSFKTVQINKPLNINSIFLVVNIKSDPKSFGSFIKRNNRLNGFPTEITFKNKCVPTPY